MKQIYTNAGEELVTIVKSSLLTKYSQDRPGLHGSDILYCSRLASFRNLEEKQGMTDTESFYFFRGEAIHLGLEKIFGDYDKNRFLVEQKYTRNDMTFTPDVIDITNKRIIEVKTTDKDEIEVPYDSNLKQLERYMAITGFDNGIIYYMLLRNPDKPYRFFEYQMDNRERNEVLLEIDGEIEELKRSISMKSPAMARSIIRDYRANWKCYRKNKPSAACPYLEKCQIIDNYVLKRGI